MLCGLQFFISMLSGGLAYYVINRFLATEVSRISYLTFQSIFKGIYFQCRA